VSLPVSSECKAQRCYESQSRQLKNEGEKIFPRFARLIGATRRHTLPSPLHIPTAQKWIHTALHTMCPLPSIFLDPPLHCRFRACMLINQLQFFIINPRRPWLLCRSHVPCKRLHCCTCRCTVSVLHCYMGCAVDPQKCMVHRVKLRQAAAGCDMHFLAGHVQPPISPRT